MITVVVAVAAAAALTTTATAKQVSCNAGFVLIHGATCIKVFTDKLTWQEASDACQAIDNFAPGSPHLAHINDCSLLSSLWDYINYQLQLENEPDTERDFWLGGSDSTVEGSWEWENLDPVPRGAPFWYPSQPDGGTLENKLVLAHNGYFADGHEDDTLGYICQYSP